MSDAVAHSEGLPMTDQRICSPRARFAPGWLFALCVLLGLGVFAGHALADADCGESEPPKASPKGKCPAGFKYSAKTKACAKVSCGTGRVWSGEQQECSDSHSAALTDQDFYDEARALVDEGHFAAALDVLHRIKKQDQPRVLNYIGYTTRKLGDVDKGLEYYHKALALDPSYLRAREYLGEGYLQKGDVGKAREQLMEIADRCGDSCEEYAKLEKAIVVFVTGDDKAASW
jgi:tetratricopeptide (TPR) repeat protein